MGDGVILRFVSHRIDAFVRRMFTGVCEAAPRFVLARIPGCRCGGNTALLGPAFAA
jgi:hypothetical protein